MSMLSLHRRHGGRDKDPGGDASTDGGQVANALDHEDQAGVNVALSPGLVELAPSLTQALGPEFCVATEGDATSGVMIVGPVGPAGVAFLRASHPGVVVLVIDRRWPSSQPAEAVRHLEAGADGYLASPLVAEVASHVRALARRVDHMSLTQPPPPPVA